MRAKFGFLLVLLSTIVVAGCDSQAIDLTKVAPPPPHQGTVMPLPGGKAVVEVVRTGDKQYDFEFYFLTNDLKPLPGAPTSGTLTVGKSNLELVASGDHLVSKGGTRKLFPDGTIGGDLKVTVDGTEILMPLGIR